MKRRVGQLICLNTEISVVILLSFSVLWKKRTKSNSLHKQCSLPGIETTAEGDSFCILHSPNPKKNDDLFWDTFRDYRQGIQFNYANMIFPNFNDSIRTWFDGYPGKPLDFRNATFLGDANFSVMNLEAIFTNSSFYGDADFHNSSFDRGTDFSLIRFKGRANFRHAKFQAPVSFHDSVFEKEADFSSDAFGQTVFQRVVFLRTKFVGQTSFPNVLFNGEAEFIETDFNSFSHFCEAEFRGETNVDATRFRSEANFRRTKFQGVTTFQGGKKEPIFFDKAILEGIRLDKKDTLRFLNVNLSKAQFLDSDVAHMDFVGVRWCCMGKVFHRTAIYEELLISDETRAPSLTSVEKLYRQLKQNYEERRDFGRAGDFHMGEKEMQLRNSDTPFGTRILLSLYKFTNGYGERSIAPVYCFTVLILYAAVLALIGGLFDKSLNRYLDVWPPADYFAALLFALDKAFHLPGEYFALSAPVRWVQTLVGVLGPLFIGLFGLAVRNRLKR